MIFRHDQLQVDSMKINSPNDHFCWIVNSLNGQIVQIHLVNHDHNKKCVCFHCFWQSQQSRLEESFWRHLGLLNACAWGFSFGLGQFTFSLDSCLAAAVSLWPNWTVVCSEDFYVLKWEFLGVSTKSIWSVWKVKDVTNDRTDFYQHPLSWLCFAFCNSLNRQIMLPTMIT